ncbi:unnamed protein product, partial [Prorocentrum cordatum]
MTAWIVREAAKFDAVGVFRPAPAAPVGADAGVPPVSGFDDLMSDARIPRAQADALLADVRAMGAVAVDEVLPADWVRLNSWALLQVLSGFEVVLTAVLVLMAIGVDADAVETKAIRDALKAVLVGKDLKRISLRERRRQVALKLGLQEHALDQRKHEFKSLTTDVVSGTQPDQDAASPLETVLAEAEKLDSLQWVYLVTISRVLDATLPDGRQHRDLGTMSREDIGKAVDDAFNNPIPTGSAGGRPRKEPDGQALVSMAVVFQEKHKDGAIHFHVAVKLTRSGRFQQAKRTLRERHLLPSHFSGSHQRMWSAVRYGYMETPAKPDVDDAPWVWQPDWARFARENDAIDLFEMSQATDKAAGAMGAKTTFDLVDLTSTIIAKHLWTKGSLMAYVQDRGTKAMQRFVRSRVRKLTADLEETKEWASAREIAAFEAVDDWSTTGRTVETIFSRNAASFDVRELAASLRDILMVGPKKTTGVPFLVGPSNSGKSTVVYPFDDLFTPKRVLHKPTLGSSFGLRNLASGTKRFIFWGDFRPVEFAHEKTVPVSLFLSLFVGQHTEIQVSQSFNDGNKGVCWNHGAVFTGKLEGLWETTNKVGAEDIRHMQNRARQFPFTSVLSDGSLKDVLSCAPCTTAWIVREAAKFDAVGVFRPAPAAPVGADAGAPPVSGFDDLMSDARIPRAQADALLADVRAMGAVAVDEVLPADWARLNSWALLPRSRSADVLGKSALRTLRLPEAARLEGGVKSEMAPHLSKRELDRCFSLYAAGKIPVEIRDLVSRTRESLDETGPDLTTVRRALRGAAHRRGPAETRGRKPKLTAVKLRALNNARVRLIRAAKGEAEVHLKDVMMAARVSDAHKGTASRHSKRLGVTWRAPRAEPLRGSAEAEERVAARSGWKRLPGNYFTHQVDAIIDNKVFPSPMTKRAKTHAKKSRVRGHLRTKAEGVLKPFTKPKGNRNRVNPGAKVHVAAAIVNNKVRVWHYLPTLWCADAACDFYAGVLAPALRRCRKGHRAFRILGDNDPTGYKSKKAVDCNRRGLKITPIKFPKYSPDLNPLDYFLWAEVNRRVATGIPKSVIRAAVAKMKTKAAEVVVAEGGRIPSDRACGPGALALISRVGGTVFATTQFFQPRPGSQPNRRLGLCQSGFFLSDRREISEFLPQRMHRETCRGSVDLKIVAVLLLFHPCLSGGARLPMARALRCSRLLRFTRVCFSAGPRGTQSAHHCGFMSFARVSRTSCNALPARLMAHVQDRGTKTMQRFVRSRVRKLTADLEETKEWASARENAAFEAVDDWTLVCRCAEETCPHGPACSYRSAVETIFSRSAASFDVRELAAPLRDILMVGPKKTTRVPFLVGPSNSGKSTVVYPFDDLFTPKRVLHKPALGSSFGLRNLASGTKRFIFWDDFRPVEFAREKTRTEIQVSQSFNDGNKDVCWNHGAVFTGKLEGLWGTTNKVGAEDIRHMQNRARHFPFSSVLSDGSLQDVLSCAPCMTAWIVREAAKFDAVGVFRPAPAAPVGADAGVPPVSGFDDLMSDARIPRAQADALLADVRAMGAVAVDEVLPADWVRLNSWALLQVELAAGAATNSACLRDLLAVRYATSTKHGGCCGDHQPCSAHRRFGSSRSYLMGSEVLSGFEVVLTAVLVLMAIGVDAEAVETKAIRDALKDAASPLETVLAEAEKLDSLQWVYLVTISRVLDATLPDGRQCRDLGTMSREDIGKAVADAFNNPIPTGSAGGRTRQEPDGQALVSMAVVFQEKHKDGAIHFHVAAKLTRSGRFQQAKRTLRERHLLPSHFSGSHQRMWSAVRYGYMETPAKPDVDDAPWVWQPDWAGFARENDAIDLFEMSQEPYMAGVWVKRREATDKAAGAMGTKTTFDLVDLTSTIIAKHLWTKGSLMAYVQDRGTKAMQRFVRSRVRKLTADLEETKEWASARENAAFEAVDDWTLVCRCAEETCPHGPACSCRSAVETIFSRNAASFDVRELAASLRDILMVGPKKTTGVPFLVGPSNSGKSTVVYPFDDLFTPKRVLHKPALGSSFGLRNLASGTKRFIFWDDFRPVEFAHEKTVPVSLFLSLFVGQHTEIQVSQSFNDGNKDVCWNHGAVFTGKLEGLWETTNKVGAEDIRHMQNRARQFPFTSVLSDGSLKDVLSCAPCTTAWIVREAAKFDAVGVFRPAPAAPVGADAGAPPVSGFDDLMSDARMPRAQADALLADVRAMGAVAVDEVLPADWARLNSWALLPRSR